MFFLSLLFSKSIIQPIKLLSQNTELERDKSSTTKKIITYPNRNDEIGKLSYDIKNMSDDLKKRIKEIEQFAADVSHELKNPLSGLKSSSDLLITNKLNEQNKKLLFYNMRSDIQRMNILISDISNYTLTQVEISEESVEKIDLINFLYDFKNSLFNNDYIIEIKSAEEEVFINVNKNKFIQVLHNLLDNAFSYAEVQSKILINISSKFQQCYIDIVDQGPGISFEYKEKIFNRFYTDRDKSRNEHTGLGLSISRSIIESFGGTMNLNKSSYTGFDGACFEIKLPLKD
jgi:two-component system sensor histidine kinase ChvG